MFKLACQKIAGAIRNPSGRPDDGRCPGSFCSEKFIPVAQAFQPVQTGWRARTPAPLTFSCFTGGPKVHERLLRKVQCSWYVQQSLS